MKSANIHKPHALAFCRDVVPNRKPVHALYEPLAGAESGECFVVVPQALAAIGGEQVVGWALWEWPRVMIEAEFHTVIRRADGKLVDVTPRPINFRKTAFLEDPGRRYEGRQVDNVRKPLRSDPLIERFIGLAERRFALLNEGDLAEQHGELAAPEGYQELQDAMNEVGTALARKYGPPR